MSGSEAGASFTAAQGRELLGRLRDLRRGALVVTSGLRDLRLVVGADEVGLESAGAPLPPGDERDLIRAFLCALFWEDPLAFVDADGTRREDVPALRVRADAEAVLGQVEQGLTELDALKERVPTLEVLVTVSGQPPPPEEDAPSARLFRAVGAAGPGGAVLAVAAEQAQLDLIDAAWATVDLLEAKQATLKRLSPTIAMRRLKRAEGLVEDGLLDGLRHEYVARGLQRAEPRRAAAALRLAGDAHRLGGRAEVAVACYRAGLQLAPEDLGAREGLVCALAALARGGDAKAARLELIERYTASGLPLRARAHLEALGEPSLEQQALLLECLLAGGEHQAAAALAEQLAPRLDPAERAALPTRFAASGAPAGVVARAVGASGTARLRPLRRALLACVALGLLALTALGLEAYARLRFAEAAEEARADLAAGRFDAARGRFAELAHLSDSLGAARWPVRTCLADVPGTLAHLEGLAADQALLDASGQVLRWRAAPDTIAADAALVALAERARTAELKALLAGERAGLGAYRQGVADEVKLLQDLVIAGRSREALQKARQIVSTYDNARDLYAERAIPVRIYAEPKAARLHLNGRFLDQLVRDTGEWELRVRLDGRPEELAVSYENHVTQTRALRFQDLRDPEVRFELVGIHADPSLSPPEAGDVRVRFVEDPRSVALTRSSARGPLALEEAATGARLAEELPTVGARQRLVVVAHSEPVRRRVYLRELSVFLEEDGRRATPFRLPVGRVERPFVDDPAGSVLQDLSQVERFPLLVEAVREAVGRMQAELAR
ncbi:MAG: hypothetical protein M9894_37560 [Planctomycetes bacterium]|nr:hypothetical protein [Planctomycetota bacterium]